MAHAAHCAPLIMSPINLLAGFRSFPLIFVLLTPQRLPCFLQVIGLLDVFTPATSLNEFTDV